MFNVEDFKRASSAVEEAIGVAGNILRGVRREKLPGLLQRLVELDAESRPIIKYFRQDIAAARGDRSTHSALGVTRSTHHDLALDLQWQVRATVTVAIYSDDPLRRLQRGMPVPLVTDWLNASAPIPKVAASDLQFVSQSPADAIRDHWESVKAALVQFPQIDHTAIESAIIVERAVTFDRLNKHTPKNGKNGGDRQPRKLADQRILKKIKAIGDDDSKRNEFIKKTAIANKPSDHATEANRIREMVRRYS